jgi:hypothetical protein
MTEQEKFEEWAKPVYSLYLAPNLHYQAMETRDAWEGWQARAALESKPVKSCNGCRFDNDGVCDLSGHLECINYNKWDNCEPSKPETAIDRLRNNNNSYLSIENQIAIEDAILELDSRLREVGK